jgi:hypothetical protein
MTKAMITACRRACKPVVACVVAVSVTMMLTVACTHLETPTVGRAGLPASGPHRSSPVRRAAINTRASRVCGSRPSEAARFSTGSLRSEPTPPPRPEGHARGPSLVQSAPAWLVTKPARPAHRSPRLRFNITVAVPAAAPVEVSVVEVPPTPLVGTPEPCPPPPSKAVAGGVLTRPARLSRVLTSAASSDTCSACRRDPGRPGVSARRRAAARRLRASRASPLGGPKATPHQQGSLRVRSGGPSHGGSSARVLGSLGRPAPFGSRAAAAHVVVRRQSHALHPDRNNFRCAPVRNAHDVSTAQPASQA